MSKHTPGPWEFCSLNKRWGIYPASAVNDGIDYFIATTRQISDPAREKANARLMAAAPDLQAALDALGKAISEADELDDPAIYAAMTKARAALSKSDT